MSISKKILVILFLFVIISISIISSYAVEYFTYQMNFENGSSRSHLQTITYTGTNLSVTIPTGFDLTNYSDGGIFSGDTLSWGSGTDRDVNYTLDSPSNCTDNGQEGDRYFSNIEVDNSFFDRFVFACVPDNKIVDYKLEYGHGDANYLSLDDFISNETATLFNLIRVFNIGHYLDIDEPANDASINCTFEKFPVRTYGRMELNHSGDNITGALLWDVIESGYWFRIGVLSQEVSGKAVGDSYNVSCTELTYNFVHERVNASFADVSLGVRNTYPFAITITPDSNKLTYNIQNIELYPTKDLFFRWNLDGGISRTEELNLLRPNETIKFDVFLEGNGTLDLDIDFIPGWYANSRNPKVYTQSNSTDFNFNNKPAQIVDLNFISLIQDFRVEMLDFGEVAVGELYRAKIWVYNFNGSLIDTDLTPNISLFDPLRNPIVNDTGMNTSETGIYTFEFNTSNQTSGVWESIVTVVVNNATVKPSDFWEVESSPAEVRIDSITDNTVPTITANVTITNEGTGAQEYQYEYCIVVDQENQCGGDDDEDYASAARLLNPGETFNPQLTLNVATTGDYFFKVVVYFGTEKSGATKSFTAISEAAVNISFVSLGGLSFIPLDGNIREIEISFLASDGQGAGNLDNSTAKVNVSYQSLTGLLSDSNDSCSSETIDSNTINYSCFIQLEYFWDHSSEWTVDAEIQNLNNSLNLNSSNQDNSGENWTITEFIGFNLSSLSLFWAAVMPADTNQTSITNETLENTGNSLSLDVKTTLIELAGVSDSSNNIPAGNFSVFNITNADKIECDFTNRTEAVTPGVKPLVGINETQIYPLTKTLRRGQGSHIENLNYCLFDVPGDLTTQTYDTTQAGNWDISIEDSGE
ncbi:hypothetical protein J4443_00335 [Candidatus Woesearchaeota archaeon]|nr:hypothetical protein [Candidatus Woesearchaeota archaeon]